MPRMAIDTLNRHMVSAREGAGGRTELVVLLPPRAALTQDEALAFAAWLVVLADYPPGMDQIKADPPLPPRGGSRFLEILEAVRNT